MQAIIYKALPTTPYKALSKLIETVWLKGNRILVYCKDKKRLEEFDNILWTYDQLSFLPHVIEGDELLKETPIVLMSNENNVNSANIIVCLDAELPRFVKVFDKLVYMYDAASLEQEKLINFIQQLKSDSIEVIEYQQEKSGAWQKIV
jgi:DNA polymerase IIIc chi subunit